MESRLWLLRRLPHGKATGDVVAKELFNRLYVLLNNGGILTTYCAKRGRQANVQAAGFSWNDKCKPSGENGKCGRKRNELKNENKKNTLKQDK